MDDVLTLAIQLYVARYGRSDPPDVDWKLEAHLAIAAACLFFEACVENKLAAGHGKAASRG